MASKKTDQDFVLSDSSINVYGFRLNTSGYLIDEFLRNPIGYYGHEREDGVLVRWEDVRIDGDRVLGKPVINMEHPRGERTVKEIEEGFLNAASVGNIVVLDFHVEDATEETEQVVVVDKWYNKECSLVDNPGNREAFRTELADSEGVVVTLQDLMDRSFRLPATSPKDVSEDQQFRVTGNGFRKVVISVTPELLGLLELGDATDEERILQRLREMNETGKRLSAEVASAHRKIREKEVDEILERGLSDGRFTQAARTELEVHFADDPEALRRLVGALPAYQSLSDRLRKVPEEIIDLAGMSYDELDKANKLQLILEKAPGLYKEKYLRKFGKAPANV